MNDGMKERDRDRDGQAQGKQVWPTHATKPLGHGTDVFADVAGYKSVSVEKPVPHRCSEEVMVGVGVTASALWTNIAAAA